MQKGRNFLIFLENLKKIGLFVYHMRVEEGGLPMKLKTYLADIDMTVKDFASLIGYDANYISSIIGGRNPGKKLAQQIESITDGMVKFSQPLKEKTNHK